MILHREESQPVRAAVGIERRVLVHGKALMLVEFTLQAGNQLPLHAHPHEQAGYVASGRLRLQLGAEFHELKAGDTYHVPPQVQHGAWIHETAVVVDAFTPPRDDYLPSEDYLPREDCLETSPAIRPCCDSDFEAIYQIINDAAVAYKGVIPPDRWHEPYMPREELTGQIAAGVVFYGYQQGGELLGVMGIQEVQDVTLVRHAYVRTKYRKQGIGGQLLRYLRGLTPRPVLIGTWADARWAIAFYEKHGFRLVEKQRVPALLDRYWGVPQRQVETSVVLTDGRLQRI